MFVFMWRALQEDWGLGGGGGLQTQARLALIILIMTWSKE